MEHTTVLIIFPLVLCLFYPAGSHQCSDIVCWSGLSDNGWWWWWWILPLNSRYSAQESSLSSYLRNCSVSQETIMSVDDFPGCGQCLPWCCQLSNRKDIWPVKVLCCSPHVGYGVKCALDSFVDFGTIYIVCLFTWLPPLTSFFFIYFSLLLLP